ncbi:MAG: N-acetylglucosamine-6-phosphate deacetylase [Ilumatobacteraceae bacterium]
MVLAVTNGRVITPGGVLPGGHVVIDGETITSVGTGASPVDIDTTVDAGGGWIAPGFIDVQINGGHGIDLTNEPQRIDELTTLLPQYGVTAFLPTIITCAPATRASALEAWRDRHGATAGTAVALGLHVEGPMLNPIRRGAHPEQLLVAPSLELIEGWSREAGVALVTLAPELPGALDVIAALIGRGVVVSLGHTDASAGQFDAGLAAGARYVTHLFNGMRPFGHRDPGPVGAALADHGVVAGLICDGIHVDPVAVRMAWRALGPQRMNLITDAVAALGTTVRATAIGSVDVVAGPTGIRTAAGVLAGSDLSLDRALRNLVAYTACPVDEAVATVTSTPADLLGLADRGRLLPGHRGDVTVLDDDLRVVATIVGGVPSPDASATSGHGT